MVDDLVQEVRSHLYKNIKSLHSTMPLWGIDRWVPLGELFVDVNLLEELSSSRRSELDNLWQDFSENPSYRSLDRIGLGRKRERVLGLEVLGKNTNLMVVGKPGSGKTTYLQRVVTECNEGNLQGHRIPVLIKLRDFVDDSCNIAYSLKRYLKKYWQLSSAKAKLILDQGRALVLLDGLDEVTGKDGKKIAKLIKGFARTYPQVQVIVTCRTQRVTGEMDWKSLRFQFVEVADFSELQVRAFAEHWFKTVIGDKSAGLAKGQQFLEQLFLEENKPIRELAITPILLSLTCAVFYQTGKFYSKRSELYEEALELLLEQWDEKRGIERDEIYRDFSVERKLELLSHLAVKKFEQEQYVLFKQEEIERYIAEFLPIGYRDSRVVLRAIEAQHGLLIERSRKIWSFSHLTFQEYLVAKWFVERADWNKLVTQVIKKHWREVLLISVELQLNVDKYIQLMKQKVDAILAFDEKLQYILVWANQKSSLTEKICLPASIRAFYLSVGVKKSFDDSLSRIISPSFNPGISHHLKCDYLLYRCLFHSYEPDFSQPLYNYRRYEIQHISITRYLDFELFLGELISDSLNSKTPFIQALIILKNKLPDGQERINYEQFWHDHKKTWREELRENMNIHRKIGQNWQLTNKQTELFEQYYYANTLLVDCLYKSCVLSDEVRKDIQETLLLPIAEIEKRKQKTAE